jgi:hypothetical protein
MDEQRGKGMRGRLYEDDIEMKRKVTSHQKK